MAESGKDRKDLEKLGGSRDVTALSVNPSHNSGSLPRGAWIVVLGAWCTSFCSFGWINSIGTFQNYYEDTLLEQYSASTIAWIPSLQVFFMMALASPTHKTVQPGLTQRRALTRFGHRVLLAAGTILHTFGLFMASVSTEYYQVFLSQGVCSAIGAAAVFLPAVAIIQERFSEKQDLALGIVTTGSSLGGVVFPIMVSHLIKQVGFGWAMRSSAFLILALLIVANMTITSNGPRKRRLIQPKQILGIFHETPFVILMVGLLLYTFGFFVPLDYVAAEAAAAGEDPNQVQYLIPMLNAASLFGRLLSGFAAEKIGRYNVFIVACYATGILVLALWKLATTTWERRLFAILFGFFSGTFIALIPGLVSGLTRAHAPANAPANAPATRDGSATGSGKNNGDCCGSNGSGTQWGPRMGTDDGDGEITMDHHHLDMDKKKVNVGEEEIGAADKDAGLIGNDSGSDGANSETSKGNTIDNATANDTINDTINACNNNNNTINKSNDDAINESNNGTINVSNDDDIDGSNDDNGFRIGAIFFSASISSLVANPICGAILETKGGWDGLKTFAGVFCIVGTTFVLFIRCKLAGWKLSAV
ncbi:major facilitator superfamily domain-containing protein [Trichoderma barbatum]